MAKHPSEVFGYPIEETSKKARTHQQEYWCPFVGQRCTKQSRLIDYPMGVCSVQYGDESVALCPKRFLQDNTVFEDIADHYWGTRSDLLVFSEVGLPRVGTFDYVMVKHKPLSSEIEDFVLVEFQTGQTTGTGKLVEGLKDFIKGESIVGRTYGFGLNLADIWKRTFTQILNKGIVVEEWRQKVYWVVQEPVYEDFLDRYNLHGMTFSQEHNTVFWIYDLARQEDRFRLLRSRVESSTIDDLFAAFRNNPNIPSKDDFVQKLERKVRANLHLKLRLGPR